MRGDILNTSDADDNTHLYRDCIATPMAKVNSEEILQRRRIESLSLPNCDFIASAATTDVLPCVTRSERRSVISL